MTVIEYCHAECCGKVGDGPGDPHSCGRFLILCYNQMVGRGELLDGLNGLRVGTIHVRELSMRHIRAITGKHLVIGRKVGQILLAANADGQFKPSVAVRTAQGLRTKWQAMKAVRKQNSCRRHGDPLSVDEPSLRESRLTSDRHNGCKISQIVNKRFISLVGSDVNRPEVRFSRDELTNCLFKFRNVNSGSFQQKRLMKKADSLQVRD